MFNRPKSTLLCNMRPLCRIFAKFTSYIQFPQIAIISEILAIYENCIYDVNVANTLHNGLILKSNVPLGLLRLSLKC